MLHTTEEEQFNALKHFLKKHGMIIAAALIVVGLGSWGFNAWTNYKAKKNLHIASLYIPLATTIATGSPDTKISDSDKKTFLETLEKIKKQNTASIYTIFGELFAAKIAYLDNKVNDAKKHLEYVVKHTTDEAIKRLATIRLAAVFIQEKKPNDKTFGAKHAVALLQDLDSSGSFAASLQDTLGDAFYELKEYDKSRTCYEKALNEAKLLGLDQSTIKLKLDNLPAKKEAKA